MATEIQIHEQHTIGNRNYYFLAGTLLKKIFQISTLNSFQQSRIPRPFSTFIIASEIGFCGLRQSGHSASLIFLFLQCGSESRNFIFPSQFHGQILQHAGQCRWQRIDSSLHIHADIYRKYTSAVFLLDKPGSRIYIQGNIHHFPSCLESLVA